MATTAPCGGAAAWRYSAAGLDALGLASAFGASLLGADAVSAAGFASPDGLAPSPPSARLRFLSPSFLKSVSYQPLPARRNDGAVSCRLTAWALHDGQVSGSGSDSFCRRSKLWPHWVHSKA
jgi:hypothetical protein